MLEEQPSSLQRRANLNGNRVQTRLWVVGNASKTSSDQLINQVQALPGGIEGTCDLLQSANKSGVHVWFFFSALEGH